MWELLKTKKSRSWERKQREQKNFTEFATKTPSAGTVFPPKTSLSERKISTRKISSVGLGFLFFWAHFFSRKMEFLLFNKVPCPGPSETGWFSVRIPIQGRQELRLELMGLG